MKDFRKNLQDNFDKASDFLKKSSGEAITKLKESAEKMTHLGPAAKDKVAGLVGDFIAILPILEEAGYTAYEFKIVLALTPILEVSFATGNAADEATIERLKKEHAEKRFVKTILSTLQMADDLAARVESDDFLYRETILEISVPPKVSLRYVNRHVPEYLFELNKNEETPPTE